MKICKSKILKPFLGAFFVFSLFIVFPSYGKNVKEEQKNLTSNGSVKSLVQEGLNYLILEDFQKAEEAFLKAKTLDPYSEESYNFLGLLYLQQGLYQKAEEMLTRAIAIEPLYAEALRNLGKLYLQQEKFSDAASYLKRAFSLGRNQAYTAYLLGMALYFSGDIPKAIEAYEEAFLIDQHLPVEAHYNLGVAYHESARYLDSIKEYEAVLKISPDHLNALNNLGLVYSMLGEKERAIELFNRVLKIDKNNVKARINMGNVYLSTKDLIEAEKIYRSAISLDNKDISPRLNLGVVFFEKGDFAKAKTEWQNILASDPSNLRVLSVMASAFLEKKQYDEAIRIFKQLVNLMPKNGGLANTLGYLLADQNKDLKLAIELVEKAIELDPANRATYLDSLAWAHYRQGDYKKAREIQNQAEKIFQISHEPISSEVHFHMGRICEKMNDLESALKAYHDAVKTNTDHEMVQLASDSIQNLERK
ncbi:MAG: tetratricopeptide repeat protein [Candidatus Riflebacteria bacterium]|nr:tetratricopeptide repeat protein [Candidatus Riflebacteria bacterium]